MEKNGREIVDDTPVEWPLGISVPETLEQKIARMVRTSVSMHAAQQGHESFDEADDFDIGDVDDEEPESVHELDDDQERISRDHAMLRRIPPAFRAQFDAYVARQREKAQKEVKKDTSKTPPVQDPAEGDKSSPT